MHYIYIDFLASLWFYLLGGEAELAQAGGVPAGLSGPLLQLSVVHIRPRHLREDLCDARQRRERTPVVTGTRGANLFHADLLDRRALEVRDALVAFRERPSLRPLSKCSVATRYGYLHTTSTNIM